VADPTPDSERLRALARRVTDALLAAGLAPASVFLTGSAAEGIAGPDSDLDLICYFDDLPDQPRFQAALAALGAVVDHPLGSSQDGFADSYLVEGTELQTGATRVARFERQLQEVHDGKHLGEPVTKIASGLLHGLPLHGEARFEAWRARAAAYPDGLRRRAVEHHLALFPIWAVDKHLLPRDALLFRIQARLQVAFNLLGVLSALNRVYFTDFQFKRMRAHAAQLAISPPRLAERLEAAMETHESFRALQDLRALAAETVALVEEELPEVDTSRPRWALEYRGR
jgi:predicted nucleotidyltransferase